MSDDCVEAYACAAPDTAIPCLLCRNADKKRLADVAVLDLDSFTWRRPAVNGTAPSPREGAGAVYHAGHMVVFGESPVAFYALNAFDMQTSTEC